MRCWLLFVSFAALLVLSACGVESDPAEDARDQGLGVGGDTVPANYRDRRSVTCGTGDKPKTERFAEGALAGLNVEYVSSDEIDYGRSDWPEQRQFSWNALSGKLGVDDNAVDVVVVDIRNVDGVPHYHYFSNGARDDLNQNWSSTKVVAQLAAAHRARVLSNGTIGTSSVINDARLGARSWASHAYALHDTSSNASGGLFKHLAGLSSPAGGGLNATSFVRGWLARPAELFNGYYGYGAFDSYYNLRAADGAGTVLVDTSEVVKTRNLLTPLAMAEFWKRVGVNFRDPALLPGAGPDGQTYGYRSYRDSAGSNAYTDGTSWSPSITEGDLLTMFYGSADPNSDVIGGMLRDIGIRSRFASAFGGGDRLDAWTGGRWRVLGKTGSGNGDSAYGAYVCLPGFRGGREFAVFVLGKAPGGTARARTTLSRVVDMFAPGLRTELPPSDRDVGEIECPTGWSKQAVGDEGGVYCTDGVSMYGPFTAAMTRDCRRFGGGPACDTLNWNAEFALALRGEALCPRGAAYDPVTTYCAEGDDAFGPFPGWLVARCEAAGGGSACRTARWSRGFLRALLAGR